MQHEHNKNSVELRCSRSLKYFFPHVFGLILSSLCFDNAVKFLMLSFEQSKCEIFFFLEMRNEKKQVALNNPIHRSPVAYFFA